jgi:TPR repeat protein
MAYFRLANLYQRGPRGVSQDPDKSFDYYQFAFQHGVFVAGSYLGEMLWLRGGARFDTVKAKQIWTQAAQLGDARSHIKLAKLKELRSTSAGIEQALLHYSIAARLIEIGEGDASASRNRQATIANSLPAERAAQIYETSYRWKPQPTSSHEQMSSATQAR